LLRVGVLPLETELRPLAVNELNLLLRRVRGLLRLGRSGLRSRFRRSLALGGRLGLSTRIGHRQGDHGRGGQKCCGEPPSARRGLRGQVTEIHSENPF